MKLGFVSSVLEKWNYEEMMDMAAELGFSCVEVACWPNAKAERRYAGVSHIDVTELTEEATNRYLQYSREKRVEISALAFYSNNMDPDLKKREANIRHLLKVVDASHKLGINLVTTFIGRNQDLSVEDNLDLVKELWPPIVKYAKERGVKIAIENCPMLFGKEQWPGGQNLMTTPALWDKIFEILPDDNVGLNYDPSHFVWQTMDYIKPIYEYREKLFHVHFKDIKVYQNKLDRVGVMAYPLDFMAPKLPGQGDVRWDQFVSALTDVGYDGYACIEMEDRTYESSKQKIRDGLILSKKYMEQFVI